MTQLAADFALRAEQRDRNGSFPRENWQALHESHLTAVAVPAELGGLDVTSAHDFAVVFNRLARGDGSTALGAMMHGARVHVRRRAAGGRP